MFLSVKLCNVALGSLSAQCVFVGGFIWQGEVSGLMCGRVRSRDFPRNFFPQEISRLVEDRPAERIKGRSKGRGLHSPDTWS